MSFVYSSVSGAPSSVDEREVARFAALAETWWDPEGPMRALHDLNPVRIGYIREKIQAEFKEDPKRLRLFSGRRILDIGCGGGLVSEPMARLGGRVTAIDAAAPNIEIARAHARSAGLDIEYRVATAETLLAEGRTFEIVTALEIVEHVADPVSFLTVCAGLVAPGGLLVLSTLNRTPAAFALAILGAEVLLNLLPRGTHSWRKFRKPSELAKPLRRAGLTVLDVSGVTYSLKARRWKLSSAVSVNYLLTAGRPKRDDS